MILLCCAPAYAEANPKTTIRTVDRQVNTWVSEQTKEHQYFDDALHFGISAIGTVVVYYGLGHFEYFQKHKWQRRILAGLVPISARVIEESTNLHPDWDHDLWGSFVGVTFMLTFTF